MKQAFANVLWAADQENKKHQNAVQIPPFSKRRFKRASFGDQGKWCPAKYIKEDELSFFNRKEGGDGKEKDELEAKENRTEWEERL